MNDHVDEYTAADDVLGAVLFAHAMELRDTVGQALDTEAGLANLAPFKGEPSAVGRPTYEDAARSTAEPANREAPPYSLAVHGVIRVLERETGKVEQLRKELRNLQDEGSLFSPVEFRMITEVLADYKYYLGWLRDAFVKGIRLEREEVLGQLNTYLEVLSLLQELFQIHCESVMRKKRRSVWVSLSEVVEKRMGGLKAVLGGIQWIFDTSDDLQEVTS
ncbi:hypothetical protein [Streptomyces sp. NPDC058412]|uniref:hypothetical protein n=1 Tax=Streptomyces sp. NPDC058412 TaxID=3346486 RepID=UPI003651CA23